MRDAPAAVRALAEQRAAARAGRDFARADALRAEIDAAGWVVRDVPEGWELTARPPYPVLAGLRELPDRSADDDEPGVTVSVLVEGWPDDLRRAVTAVLAHAPEDVRVVGLDLGNVDGAGDVLHELASAHPRRVVDLHVAGAAGWGEARAALARWDTRATHVWLDPSVELTGDAVTPLVAALVDPAVGAAGGWGVDVDPSWREFADATPGEVDAVLGYLLAFRRTALLAVGGPHPKARFYRNADMELSLALREAGWKVVMTEPLPAERHRHRGYHDSDPAYRDRESRRTYDRLLQRFRGRTDLLAPRR